MAYNKESTIISDMTHLLHHPGLQRDGVDNQLQS